MAIHQTHEIHLFMLIEMAPVPAVVPNVGKWSLPCTLLGTDHKCISGGHGASATPKIDTVAVNECTSEIFGGSIYPTLVGFLQGWSIGAKKFFLQHSVVKVYKFIRVSECHEVMHCLYGLVNIGRTVQCATSSRDQCGWTVSPDHRSLSHQWSVKVMKCW